MPDLRHGATTVSIGVNKANLLTCADDLNAVRGAGATMLHVDVMDGVFCPGPIAGDLQLVAAVAAGPNLTDVHLMIEDPLEKVGDYVAAGADMITFQVEAARQPLRVLQVLGESDVTRGVALNPSTPVGVIEPLLDHLEYVLVLLINPGWGGQTMLASFERRLEAVRALVDGREIAVGADGGVTRANVGALAAARPDVLVTGTAVFAGGDPAEGTRFMHAAVQGAS